MHGLRKTERPADKPLVLCGVGMRGFISTMSASGNTSEGTAASTARAAPEVKLTTGFPRE
jgi:hypothetical protein